MSLSMQNGSRPRPCGLNSTSSHSTVLGFSSSRPWGTMSEQTRRPPCASVRHAGTPGNVCPFARVCPSFPPGWPSCCDLDCHWHKDLCTSVLLSKGVHLGSIRLPVSPSRGWPQRRLAHASIVPFGWCVCGSLQPIPPPSNLQTHARSGTQPASIRIASLRQNGPPPSHSLPKFLPLASCLLPPKHPPVSGASVPLVPPCGHLDPSVRTGRQPT
jgi:hypothetical protein